MTPTVYFPELTGVCAFSTHAGFNVCDYAGAEPSEADFEALERFSGVGRENMVWPRQTHSVNVAIVDSRPAATLSEVDAIVTARRGLLIGIHTADCAPLLMVDPVAGVIAACHCGWRGTVGGIAAKTLGAMRGLGAEPGRIRAIVGPCICPQCFEVGPEVAGLFPEGAVIRREGVKPRVDLAAAIALQLPGVDLRRSGLCSMEDSRFLSVRRQGYSLGRRTLSAIALR